MLPIAFSFGQLEIHSFGLLMAIAFAASTLFALSRAEGSGISRDSVLDIAIIAILGGVIGARFWFAVLYPAAYLADPLELIRLWKGGLAVQGGILLGGLAVYSYARRKKIEIGALADMLAPPLILGQAIGRLGCFLNGCCYGRPTDNPFGIIFSSGTPAVAAAGKVPLIPTQLLLATGDLALLGILFWLERAEWLPARRGNIFWSYLAGASLLRFAVEFLRYDTVPGLLGLTVAQSFSLIGLALGSIGLIYGFRRRAA